MEIWHAAIALTGVFGIGAFVLWRLYHRWLNLKVFPRLTQEHTFRLFRLFLILTALFAFAAVVAFIYRERLQAENKRSERKQSNNNVRTAQSKREFREIVRMRRQEAEVCFSAFLEDPKVEREAKPQIAALKERYLELTDDIERANLEGNQSAFYDAVKARIQLLDFGPVTRFIPRPLLLELKLKALVFGWSLDGIDNDKDLLTDLADPDLDTGELPPGNGFNPEGSGTGVDEPPFSGGHDTKDGPQADVTTHEGDLHFGGSDLKGNPSKR